MVRNLGEHARKPARIEITEQQRALYMFLAGVSQWRQIARERIALSQERLSELRADRSHKP